MRQQRREHDECERVGILIAVEHVTNERAFGLVHAGGKLRRFVEKPGQSGSAIVCLTASACNGASPR